MVSFPWSWRYPTSWMVYKGKPHLEMDDDWGYIQLYPLVIQCHRISTVWIPNSHCWGFSLWLWEWCVFLLPIPRSAPQLQRCFHSGSLVPVVGLQSWVNDDQCVSLIHFHSYLKVPTGIVAIFNFRGIQGVSLGCPTVTTELRVGKALSNWGPLLRLVLPSLLMISVACSDGHGNDEDLFVGWWSQGVTPKSSSLMAFSLKWSILGIPICGNSHTIPWIYHWHGYCNNSNNDNRSWLIVIIIIMIIVTIIIPSLPFILNTPLEIMVLCGNFHIPVGQFRGCLIIGGCDGISIYKYI